jgi:hypothetical protein
VYQGGAVNAGIVRFTPGDFLSANCIANLWGGAALSSVAGDDSAANLLIQPGDMYSVTGCSLEFIPEVVFLDRGGSFVISRYQRIVTSSGGGSSVSTMVPALESTVGWPYEGAAAAGTYPQELENVNRIEFDEFTLPIFPLDPTAGHAFTQRVNEVDYGSAALATTAFLSSPEYNSKVAAWGMIQVEFIAPSGFPADNTIVGHFRIRRSIQEMYLPSAYQPISYTLAAGIMPAIVLPDDVKESIYALESELAVKNTPVRGKSSFAKATDAIGGFFRGAFDSAEGLAVGVQSALAKGIGFVKDNPKLVEGAVQAAALLLSRGRTAPMLLSSKSSVPLIEEVL